jgi:hypothetical protein
VERPTLEGMVRSWVGAPASRAGWADGDAPAARRRQRVEAEASAR